MNGFCGSLFLEILSYHMISTDPSIFPPLFRWLLGFYRNEEPDNLESVAMPATSSPRSHPAQLFALELSSSYSSSLLVQS